MNMMIEIRLARLKYLKMLCIEYIIQKLACKNAGRNKSLLLKNVNKVFYFRLKMSFRGCLYESRDKMKNETGRFSSSLYM